MKLIKLFLVAIVVIFASTAQADGHIGPAVRVDSEGCGVLGDDFTYFGDGRIQYSNGNTGHATYKCKLELTDGSPTDFYMEFSLDVIGSDGCWNTISIEGNKGMWTAQCFGAWESGD